MPGRSGAGGVLWWWRRYGETGAPETPEAGSRRLSAVCAPSKSGNQVPDPRAKRLGDFDHIIHGRGFDSSFNPADENGGEVCPFSQFFLAESCLFPFGSDVLAQQAAVFFNGRHDHPKEQEDGKLRHVGNDQFFSVDFPCIHLGEA